MTVCYGKSVNCRQGRGHAKTLYCGICLTGLRQWQQRALFPFLLLNQVSSEQALLGEMPSLVNWGVCVYVCVCGLS